MRLIFILTFSVVLLPAFAQDSTVAELSDLSLEALMNMKINVASQKASSVRETPGAITVITDEDIRRSGAVELTELLMMIPGFDPGRDYENNVTFGVRGNWGIEGKILMMIDGQMLNEASYGSATSKNRIPLNQIKRIEIIRGPGSVIYGGVASLAVISIITKTGADMKGISASGNYGFSEGSRSGVGTEVNAGSTFGKLDLAVHAGWKNSNISNRRVTDYGKVISYADSSAIRNTMLRLKARYGGLSVTGMVEDYRLQYTYGYPGAGNAQLYNSFSGMYMGGEYTAKISKAVSIVPYLQWKKQDPWNSLGDSASAATALTSYRTQAGVKSSIAFSDKVSLLLGSEYYQLNARYLNRYDTTMLFNSTQKSTMSLNNIAAFSELVFSSRFGNLMAGARFDHHSTAGSAFVPRFAYTKAWKRAHAKATYSKAFRTPLIFNVDINTNLKPELVTVVDLEGGVGITDDMYITVNFSDTRIRKEIIYDTDLSGNVTYANKGDVGTRGLEAQYQWSHERIQLKLAYATYVPYKNTVEAFQYENSKRILLAMPTNKITGSMRVPLHKFVDLSTTLMWVGKRYSYGYDTAYALVPYTMNPSFLWNAFVTVKDIPLKNLSVQFGAKDMLNSGFSVGMPYKDGFGNLPFMRREFQLKIIYEFKR